MLDGDVMSLIMFSIWGDIILYILDVVKREEREEQLWCGVTCTPLLVLRCVVLLRHLKSMHLHSPLPLPLPLPLLPSCPFSHSHNYLLITLLFVTSK